MRKIDGQTIKDDRGKISFINGFTFSGVKRFYQIQPENCDIIRAFHGHMKEEKYVYVAKGKILFCVVKIQGKDADKNEPVKRYILSGNKPQIIHVPGGYANGFRALENDSIIIFFSNFSVEESKKDDYRFDPYYWGDEVWK